MLSEFSRFAATRAGITQIVLPRRNEKDLGDIPEDVRAQVDIQPVERVEEALELTLEP